MSRSSIAGDPSTSQTLPSVCPLDCPDTCSMTVTVEDARIVKVRGLRVNPLTRGTVCAKVTHYPELVHGLDRILTPLQRVGPKGEHRLTPISWDDALDLIHARFTTIGREWVGSLDSVYERATT